MLPSGSDFFACGHKVHMPNIQAGSKSQRTNERKSGIEESNGSGSNHYRRRQTRSYPLPSSQFSVQNHVDELSKTLEFSYDVVSSRSPHMISYSHGRGKKNSLFKTNGLGISTTTHERTTKANGGVVVHHNCRSKPKIPMDLLSPTYTEKTMPMSASRGHSTLTPSNELVSTERRLQRTSVVPLSKSFPWEQETLHKVSSSTARRLVGLPSTLSATQSHASYNQQQLSPRQSRIRESHESEYKMDWTERSLSPPLKSYMSQMRTGAKPVHQTRGDPERIVLSNDAHFSKVLQNSYPQSPRFDKDEQVHSSREGEISRGYRKWLDYPQPVKTPDAMQWECQSIDSQGSPLNKEQSSVPLSSPPPQQCPIHNQQFFNIMHEWCNKWQLHLQLKDVKDDGNILDDMHSLCDNTKMFAIKSVALLAESEAISRAKSLPGVDLCTTSEKNMTHSPRVVSSQLIEGLNQLLSNKMEHIKVPSALTLYCLDKQNQQTEDVLLSIVSNGIGFLEKWVSAQCLACADVCSATVISELITHLQDGGHQAERKEKAGNLLASLSTKTNLVHVLLAEQLNSSGWQERLAVCQMLHRLNGGINKDLCSKLVVLTWNDWSPEVRQAAAQALGLTGHGKLVHDEIGKRLASETETVCLDALKKLHTLHFMTDQLLPVFLSCFKDDHISIRIEATTIAGSLKLTHPHILQALHKLLQDPCWKVKAHALRAFADIGVSDEELVTQLLWAVRFERLPAIRAEACRTIARLRLKEEKVIQTLRELLMVEEEESVLREVSLTLQTLGCSSEAKDEMLNTIRSEVQRLGTLEAITRDILGSERSTVTQYVSERPLKLLTTRDYLNDKHRYRHYSSNQRAHRKATSRHSSSKLQSSTKGGSENTTHTSKQQTALDDDDDDGGGGLSVRKSWTPDRKTIDTQLNRMRRRVSVDVSG